MGSRLELHEKLKKVLGSSHVYFQAPSSEEMKYPAIRYELMDIDIRHADNRPYKHVRGYTVTLIDSNPDSEYLQPLAELPYCRFARHYRADNLNHYVFELYY